MHFLESYLAAVFYFQLPLVVRQPIYGLLVGNFIGIANCPGDGDSFEQLFSRDERLYRAKRAGKNRAVAG
jgi:GGDEF domain-containing protein